MIKFKSQIHNFGTVGQNSKLTHSFELTEDSEELQSYQIETSCGCTSATYNSQTRSIIAGLRTDGAGQKSTTITITKDNNKTYLILQATVV